MYKAILILLLFVFACHSNEVKNIGYLDEGMNRCNSVIESINDRYFTIGEIRVLENPAKNRKHKILLDKIKLNSGKIFEAIDFKKEESVQLDQKNANTEQLIEKADLTKLIQEYKNLIDSLFPKDSIIQYQIRNGLNLDNLELKTYRTQEFNLLKNKIQIINHLALEYYTRKMDGPKYNPHKLEVAVIPENRYLHKNNIYKARLYLVTYDTAANLSIAVENKKLDVVNGKAIYVDTITSIPGIREL